MVGAQRLECTGAPRLLATRSHSGQHFRPLLLGRLQNLGIPAHLEASLAVKRVGRRQDVDQFQPFRGIEGEFLRGERQRQDGQAQRPEKRIGPPGRAEDRVSSYWFHGGVTPLTRA